MNTSLKILVTLLIFSSGLASAQSGKYEAAMKQALAAMDTAKNSEQYIALANQFERIASVETKQWLPVYYAAYANLIAGISAKTPADKDRLFSRALSQLDNADALSPENSEIWTVRGYTQFMTMSVDPMSRMDMMQKASISLEKAKKLDPENPRPWLVHGQNTFYTPEAFGGGKSAAKPLLTAAASKFENFKTENLLPDWGKGRCKMLLEQCQ